MSFYGFGKIKINTRGIITSEIAINIKKKTISFQNIHRFKRIMAFLTLANPHI